MIYSKKDTQIAKGVAICLMVYHHLFNDPAVYAEYGLVFPLFGEGLTTILAALAKVCVFMFLFLTAYGITRATAGFQKNSTLLTRYSLRRYVVIMAGYLWVFVLAYAAAWIFRGSALFTISNPVELYGDGLSGFCYTFFDAIGLAFLMRGPTLCLEWWFWSIAVLTVFAMPAFLRWYEKNGIATYVIACLLANFFYMIDREGLGHLTMLPLGIAMAKNNVFERFRAWRPLKGESGGARVGSTLLRLCIAGAFTVFFLGFGLSGVSFYIGFQLGAVGLLYLCYEFLGAVPVLRGALAFLGDHSMNIFLVHTLIMRGVPRLIYAPRYGPLVFLLLMGASLCFSLLFGVLKKVTGYEKLTVWLIGKTQLYGAKKPATEA